jgi:predicted transcriptional regulator
MLMGKASIDITDKARHDKIASLVERMLELTPLLSPRQAGGWSGPRTPQEVERVMREVESTDRQIDRLVYELYGLTDEEIRIVEGN